MRRSSPTGRGAGTAMSAECALVEPESLTSAAGAPEFFDRYPMYRDGLEWLQQFVTRPHPDLGRRGAVCPRLAPALQADLVWLVSIRPGGGSAAHAAGVGPVLRHLFADVAGGERFRSAALLAFFPDVPASCAAEFIDGGHQLLRAQFVEQGLMLGEFHPASAVGSVHNPLLPVMRCPVPMFAVRALTTHDLLFLDQPQTPPAARLNYLRLYHRHLGDRLSPAGREDLDARIDATQALVLAGVR